MCVLYKFLEVVPDWHEKERMKKVMSRHALKHLFVISVTSFILVFLLFPQVAKAETETFEICVVELTTTDDGIELTWNAIDGAEEYEIYRKKEDSTYSRIAITNLTSYTDETVEDDITYTYYVQPVSESTTWGYEEASIVRESEKTKASTKFSKYLGVVVVISWVVFLVFGLLTYFEGSSEGDHRKIQLGQLISIVSFGFFSRVFHGNNNLKRLQHSKDD